MRVYPASKVRHWQLWQALREMGLDIQASWIDQPFNQNGAHPSAEEWADHWKSCIEEARSADVLLFVDLPGENQCGALIEMGAALAAGKRVYIVSENFWSVENHTRVRKFSTIAEALPYCRSHQEPT